MADKCDPLRSTLKDLKEQLAKTEKMLSEGMPGEHHPPKPVVNPEWRDLKRRVDSAYGALVDCEKSLIPNERVPLTLTLVSFECLDQSDEIRVPFGLNTEDDEPYSTVFAVDLKTDNIVGSPLGAINSKMTLVGPLADMDPGERSAPPNVIWGLSNAPDVISSADNFITLVAMMENDKGSPEQVRTVLEKATQLSLVTNLPALTSRQIGRPELVSRMIADMTGAMGAAKVGFPDPDDNIGLIQELRFFQAELDDVYRNLGAIEKSLTFEGDDAKYVLKFKMFR